MAGVNCAAGAMITAAAPVIAKPNAITLADWPMPLISGLLTKLRIIALAYGCVTISTKRLSAPVAVNRNMM